MNPSINRYINRFLHIITGMLFSFCLIFTVSACTQEPETKEPGNRTADKTISNSVESQLASASEIPADSIRIATENGVVTLSGSTTNLLAKKKATEVTQAVGGVISVVNNLKITASRPDNALNEDITRALKTDPATETYEISSTVTNGAVTLKGATDSWQEKQLVTAIVSGIKGVKEINNRITVEAGQDRPAKEIQAEVEKTLMFDSRIGDKMINVDANSRKVTLSGKVGSAKEKQLAIEKAHVTGVEKVVADDLEVHPEINSKRFRNTMISSLTPREVQLAIERALVYDPRVEAEEVEVRVEEKTAILTGTVQNLNSKLAASKDARNTAGVEDIKNNIRVQRKVVVKPDIPTTDKAIKNRVKNSILRDPYVEEARLGVQVDKGIVKLTGNVNSKFEKRQVTKVTRDVKGVIAINNQLKIDPESGETVYH